MHRIVIRELVIIEQDPAQRLETLVGTGGELAGGFGQPDQNRARLRHSLPVHFEHRDLAHRVGAGPPVRIPRLAASKINSDWLPIEAGAIQIERQFVRIARTAIAMQLVVGHSLTRTSVAALRRSGARARYWARAASSRAIPMRS